MTTGDAETKNMLKISELAKRAGVTVATVKHYLAEGLLPRPVKTGRTMAYYDESFIDRIVYIKRLQREKFLPLEVIKRMMDSGDVQGEDMALGKAIFKTESNSFGRAPIPESQIVGKTELTIEKIRLLEREKFISPSDTPEGRTYSYHDLKIIELVRDREKSGVPVEHSIRILRAYRDALDAAIREDMKLFITSFPGELTTDRAINLMTNVDESIDTFIVAYRQRIIREVGFSAVKRLNELAERLNTLNFLPVVGTVLPETPRFTGRNSTANRVMYSFLTGDFGDVIRVVEEMNGSLPDANFIAAGMFALTLSGRTDEALEMVAAKVPKPSSRPLLNAAAALTYVTALGKASGLKAPMNLVRRMLAYVRRIKSEAERNDLEEIISHYVCGTICVLMPDFLDTLVDGVDMLKTVKARLEAGEPKLEKGPRWLRKTVAFEVLPAIELRVNRFLAEGLLRIGDGTGASSVLNRVVELSDPDSEFTAWANIQLINLGPFGVNRT